MGPWGWSRVGLARGLRDRTGASLAIVVLVALALLLVGAPQRAAATFPGRNGDFLMWNPNGTSSLWLARPDGGRRHRHLIYASPEFGDFIIYPVFAPSGRQIAFVLDSRGLMVADADGRHPTQLGPALAGGPEYPGGLAFSPNGRVLAYNSTPADEPGTQVTFVSVTTGTVLRSFTLRGDLLGVVWSPSGYLLFQAERDGSAIEMIRADGSHLHKLKIKLPGRHSVPQGAGANNVVNAAPSPDGSKIAITVRRHSKFDVYLVPATGGRATRLTRLGAAFDPVWSPDGHEIAVAYNAKLSTLTGLVNVATGHVTKVPPFRFCCVVDWQALRR